MNKINIAIDGFSSCGKSTLAKQLAKELNYVFIDTGAMYRAVTLYALQNGYFGKELSKASLLNDLSKINIAFEYNSERGASDVLLNGVNVESEIRGLDVASRVSEVAAIKEVRQKLVALQQQMGEQKGVVMDGRDIGTVVFPDAELKIFMTASKEVRTKRRFDEMKAKGENPSLQEVQKNLEHRDHIDSTRKEDPLKQAQDAVVLDNSDLNMQQQFEMALQWAKDKL